MSGTAELERVLWNLDDLVDGEQGALTALDEADRHAAGFEDRYRGALESIDADGLRAAMEELAKIEELVGRAASYAQLRFSTDTADPTSGALLQRVEERATALATKLIFFELEWAALSDQRADQLLAGDGLEFC